jgi:TolB-like protein
LPAITTGGSIVSDFLQRLRERKLVQWALAYAAAAFALLQGLDIVAQQFDWPDGVRRGITIALIIGFFVTLVLAWYHGERGVQRVSGSELLILTLLLVIGGVVLWRVAPNANAPSATVAATPASGASAPMRTIPVDHKSIAVLPFVNMSGDAKNEYFSDGITEEILDALTHIPDLKVAARTSAFAFKGKGEDLRKVGEMLGVANVLEGSVQRAGDDVRITAQLIDAHNGFHRWSEKYDRKLTSVFAVEDEISKAIADQLKLRLAEGNQSAQTAVDPRAHDAYLRGLALLAARERGLLDAVKAFEQAVAIESGYAQAWGALAETEVLLPNYNLDSMEAAIPRGESAARRALSIDPDTASAHVALGEIYISRAQWPQAEEALRRALAAAPGDVEAIDQHAQVLYAAGQLEPALAEIERAQRLDPLARVIGVIRAQILLALHRYEAAAAQIESTLAVNPDFALAHNIAAVIDLNRHRYTEAETEFRLHDTLNGKDPDATAFLVRGIADPKLRVAALHNLETAPADAQLRGDPIVHAVLLTHLGQYEDALVELESYAVHRNSTNPQILWDPGFDAIRGEPRFKDVLKKLGLPYKPSEESTP